MVKIRGQLEESISAIFIFCFDIVKVAIVALLAMGSLASMVLLHKLFPDSALYIIGIFTPIFNVLWLIFEIVIVAGILMVFIWAVFSSALLLLRNKDKKDSNHKKFMNELVIKLKKELKNK